jgi:hypothetical protein
MEVSDIINLRDLFTRLQQQFLALKVVMVGLIGIAT